MNIENRQVSVGLLICALIATIAPQANAREVGFWGLGDLPGGKFYSIANGVSADGSTVVGESFSDAGREPFVWSFSDGMRALGDAPILGRARAASGDGSVVVGELSSVPAHGFRWTEEDGVQPIVPTVRCSSCTSFDVSVDGATIVGRGNPNQVFPGNTSEAFSWTEAGGMRALGMLPDAPSRGSQATAVSANGSVVVGSGRNATTHFAAFRWDEAGGMRPLGELPGGREQSIASDVSPDGSIVVGQSLAEEGPEAFVWTAADGMRSLGDLPGSYHLSLATTVNDDGTVLGRATTFLGNEPFLWTEVDGMRTVQEILDENGIDTTGWTLFVCCVSPGGMSSDGRTIAGTGRNPEGGIEAWVAVLPEPLVRVRIDVRPGSEANRIHFASSGRVPVVLFGSDELPVDGVDEASLIFGPGSAEPISRIRVRDRDGDGFPDLNLFFRIRDAGLALGDTEACIGGTTIDGVPLEGCDSIEIVPACGPGHLQTLALVPSIWLGGRWRTRSRRRGGGLD